MILLPQQKLAIITPPKCGSNSLEAAYWDCAKITRGVCCGTHAVKHNTDVPEGYRVLVVIRNPWDRLVSLWHQWKLDKPDPPLPETFPDFLRLIDSPVGIYNRKTCQEISWFYKWPASHYHPFLFQEAFHLGLEAVNGVIRLENANVFPGLKRPVPHKNRSEGTKPQWDSESLALAEPSLGLIEKTLYAQERPCN